MAFSLRGVAALLLAMLMLTALAGCGGGSPDDGRDDDGRDRDSSGPEATESREEATEDRATRRETRQASPGATAEPEATEAAGGAMPRLGGVKVVEETEGEFASVSAGGGHTCWVKPDGAVACWGNDEFGEARPPGGEFASVSAGGDYTCGVKRDGAVVCWGSQARGLTAADFE